MLEVRLDGDQVYIGERFSVSFQRTLRVPDNAADYPLPPGLGIFPVQRVATYRKRIPAQWKDTDLFIPMYQREAIWLAFGGAYWKPNAVLVGVGNINAISGEPLDVALHADPQNYLVCPDQPWLDGIRAEGGRVRQFVAMPLGGGYTIEGQLTGKEEFGGIQLIVYEPKPGIFPHEPPEPEWGGSSVFEEAPPPASGSAQPQAMGVGAGGSIQQKIYPDPHGVATWDQSNYGSLTVHIVNSDQYRTITGHEPPATPVNASYYTDMGLPWFGLYDEDRGDLTASKQLGSVKSVKQTDAEAGKPLDSADQEIEIAHNQIKRLGIRRKQTPRPE